MIQQHRFGEKFPKKLRQQIHIHSHADIARLFIQAYGSYDQEVRDPVEWEGILEYTENISELVGYLLQQEKYSQVILTFMGGMLDRKGLREADTWVPFGEKLVETFGKERVYITTPVTSTVWTGAIIKHALIDATADMASAAYYKVYPPDFFLISDTVRQVKTNAMMRRVMRVMARRAKNKSGSRDDGYWRNSERPDLLVVGFPRGDSHRNSRPIVQWMEIVAHFFHPKAFEKKMLQARAEHLPKGFEFPR